MIVDEIPQTKSDNSEKLTSIRILAVSFFCKNENIRQSMDDSFSDEAVVRREIGGRVDVQQPQHPGRRGDPPSAVAQREHIGQ